MSVCVKVFHLIAVLHYYFGLFYYVTKVADHEQKHRKYKFGGIFVHLTLLNYIIHTVYFSIALLNDFIGSNSVSTKNRPLIRKVRDYIFGSLAIPLTVAVFGLFWILFIIKRELIFPPALDAFFPWWLNHFMHTNIAPFMLIEMIVLYHKYPSLKAGLAGITAFMCGYLIWVLIIKFETNYWVYPLLNRFEWRLRIILFATLFPAGMAVYLIAEFVNNLIWYQGRIESVEESEICNMNSRKNLLQ